MVEVEVATLVVTVRISVRGAGVEGGMVVLFLVLLLAEDVVDMVAPLF